MGLLARKELREFHLSSTLYANLVSLPLFFCQGNISEHSGKLFTAANPVFETFTDPENSLICALRENKD